jgi:hypothetical protein
MLLTVLATLPFLAALGLAGVAIAATWAESGNKVLLALKGRSPLAEPAFATLPVTVRFSPRPAPQRRSVAVQPRWRAAA